MIKGKTQIKNMITKFSQFKSKLGDIVINENIPINNYRMNNHQNQQNHQINRQPSAPPQPSSTSSK